MTTQTIYPSKLLEQFRCEPYTVWLVREEEKPDDYGPCYTVKAMREAKIYCRKSSLNMALANAWFEREKEIAIIKLGCEAFNIDQKHALVD